MSERLYADPAEVDPSRLEVCLHSGTDDQGYGFWIAEAGPDWGDAAIEQYLAQLRYGQIPVDHRFPNRVVTLPMVIQVGTRFTFDDARRLLQQKVALWREAGGTLKRVLPSGRAVYLDVIKADLKMGGSTLQAQYDCDVDVVLTLETLPDWWGTEEDLGDSSTITNELSNPSFEDGTSTGWEFRSARAPGFSLSVARVGTNAKYGVSYATFGDSFQRQDLDLQVPAASMIAATPGESVAFSAWVSQNGPGQMPGEGMRCFVRFYRSDRTTLVGTIDGSFVTTRGWDRAFVIGTVPATAAYAQPVVRAGNQTTFNTYSVLVDGLLYMRSASALVDYFDGDTPGYKWGSTWHGSSSQTAMTRAVVRVPGDYPARMRAVLSSRNADDRRGLMYALRPYDSAVTAQIDHSATGMTPLGGAVATTRGSAACVERTSLTPGWVSVLSTRLWGNQGGNLTHVGPHRVLMSINRIGAGNLLQARFDWALGSQVGYTSGRIQTLSDGYTWVDLGIVNLDRLRVGTHEWEGRLLVNAPAAGTIQIVRVMVLPINYASGRVNASTLAAQPSDLTAWDSFELQTAGNLHGRSLPSGSSWVCTSGTGSSFQLQATTGLGYAQRTDVPTSASSGIAFNQFDEGEFAIVLSLNRAYVDITLDCEMDLLPNPGSAIQVAQGIVARYVDRDNLLAAFVCNEYRFNVTYSAWMPYQTMYVAKVVAGTLTLIGQGFSWWGNMSGRHTHRLVVYANGWLNYYVDGTLQHSIFDSVLATGGTLDDGSIGIYDMAWGTAAATVNRRYHLISASSSTAINDAVLYANEVAELRTSGYYRDAGSGVYANIMIDGDNPRIPVSGAEQQEIEVYVHPMKSPVGSALPDSLQGLSTMEVHANPCYLFTPDGS